MSELHSLLFAIAINIASYYVCKWLDGKFLNDDNYPKIKSRSYNSCFLCVKINYIPYIISLY